MGLIHAFIFHLLEIKIMTIWISSSFSHFFLTHPLYTIWFLSSVLRFSSWDQGPKMWTLLFSICNYLKPLMNMKIKKSNEGWYCKRKTDLPRFFSNFLCCICMSFCFDRLFMCDFPFLLCLQHATNTLILFQGHVYTIICLLIQSNRHSSPSLRRSSSKVSARPDFYQWFFPGRKVLLIGFLTPPRKYSVDNIIFSRFLQSWKSAFEF